MPANASAQVTVLKCADISPHTIAALECAIKTAMPPRDQVMDTKSHVAQQQTLALLEDMSVFCFLWRKQDVERLLGDVFVG